VTSSPRRVYTILGAALAVFTAAAAPGASAVDLSVDRNMVRGPAAAPVTIVEFADYQ